MEFEGLPARFLYVGVRSPGFRFCASTMGQVSAVSLVVSPMAVRQIGDDTYHEDREVLVMHCTIDDREASEEFASDWRVGLGNAFCEST